MQDKTRYDFPAIEEMRLPIEYLANLFTAGDVQPVKESLQKWL